MKMHGHSVRKPDRLALLGKTRSTLAHVLPQRASAPSKDAGLRRGAIGMTRERTAAPRQSHRLADLSPFHTRVMPSFRAPLADRRLARPIDAAAGMRRLTLFGLVLVALFAHGFNMFHDPSHQWIALEGAQVARAWSLLSSGTVLVGDWWSQAPGGPLLLAGWTRLTGGPHTFGTAIDSARVLMLLLHLAMLPLLFRIARKLGCRDAAASFAVLLFSLSPLVILYQRFVLSDGLMVWWLLASLNLLLDGWLRRTPLLLSGLCFGLAVLTAPQALVLLPLVLLLIGQQYRGHQAVRALVVWFLPVLPLGMLAAIAAIRHGAPSILPLLRSAHLFVPRGQLFSRDAPFWQLLQLEWLPRDPLLLGGGLLATALNLIAGIRDRRRALGSLLAVLPLLYLATVRTVVDVSLLLALPFLCLNLALLADPLLRQLSTLTLAGRRRPLVHLLVVTMAVALLIGYWQQGRLAPLYAAGPESADRTATGWIKTHLPADSVIAAVDSVATDLQAPGLGGDGFVAVRPVDQLLPNKEGDRAVPAADYLLVPAAMTPGTPALAPALSAAVQRATLLKQWGGSEDGLSLWQISGHATAMHTLASSNAYLAHHFDHDGAYVAPDGRVLASAQADAMLRSVWSNDRSAFAEAWGWSEHHMLRADGLLQEEWRGDAHRSDRTAAAADSDAALALLLAGKQWGVGQWEAAGRKMLSSMWAQDVVTLGGKAYLLPGNWAQRESLLPLRPSDFAPYAYRVFAQADTVHPWQQLVDSSYEVLAASAHMPLDGSAGVGLPPEWVGLERGTGQLVGLHDAVAGSDGCTTCYGSTAPRSFWRVALDLRSSGDERARSYLAGAAVFERALQTETLIDGGYTHTGLALGRTATTSGSAGALAALLTQDPHLADKLFGAALINDSRLDHGDLYWGAPDDLEGQAWGWYATALYANAVPDVWPTH